ncbi:MAG: glycosyl hydrolase [Planctomycetota bacterium]
MNTRRLSCLALLLTLLTLAGNRCAAQRQIPVASNRKAAAAILNYLYDGQPADGVLTGQNLGHSNHDIDDGYRSYFKPLKYRVGRTPAIMSVDYGYDEITRSFADTHYRLIRHADAGGIVTISMHPPNPWHNSDSHDTSTGNLLELLKPGTRVHQRWRKELDHVAKGLAELRDQNIIVLWRPFHEMNGGWFWWCPENKNGWPEPEAFVAVWRDMFDYFTHEKKLDNLLWVYSAAVQTSRHDPSAIQFYPGNDVVDITGLDWYMDDVSELDRYGSYSQLVKLGKPLGLTEFGPSEKRDGTFQASKLIKATKRYPKLRFYVFWHSWPGAHVAMVDIVSGPQLLLDTRAVTLKQLPLFSDSANARQVKSTYP